MPGCVIYKKIEITETLAYSVRSGKIWELEIFEEAFIFYSGSRSESLLNFGVSLS